MRAAQIENSVVVNVVVVDTLDALPGLVELQDGFGIGDGYADGSFSKPTAVVAVPPIISALQGLLAIDQAGMSSAYEAWANNAARTFSERAYIAKAKTWRRDDPILNSAAGVLGLTESQVDELFILAASI